MPPSPVAAVEVGVLAAVAQALLVLCPRAGGHLLRVGQADACGGGGDGRAAAGVLLWVRGQGGEGLLAGSCPQAAWPGRGRCDPGAAMPCPHLHPTWPHMHPHPGAAPRAPDVATFMGCRRLDRLNPGSLMLLRVTAGSRWRSVGPGGGGRSGQGRRGSGGAGERSGARRQRRWQAPARSGVRLTCRLNRPPRRGGACLTCRVAVALRGRAQPGGAGEAPAQAAGPRDYHLVKVPGGVTKGGRGGEGAAIRGMRWPVPAAGCRRRAATGGRCRGVAPPHERTAAAMPAPHSGSLHAHQPRPASAPSARSCTCTRFSVPRSGLRTSYLRRGRAGAGPWA